MFASEMYVFTFVNKTWSHRPLGFYLYKNLNVECFESAVPTILSYAPTFFPPSDISLNHSRNYTFSMFVSFLNIKVEDILLTFRLLPIALPKLTIKIQKLKFVFCLSHVVCWGCFGVIVLQGFLNQYLPLGAREKFLFSYF